MSAKALFTAAVVIALFGLLIVSSELWHWASIPAIVSLALYFVAVRQHDKEEDGA